MARLWRLNRQGRTAGFGEIAMESQFNKIMVVDDTPANLKLLKEMLQRIGFTVSVFRSGADAVASLQYSHPDIILMDINMPEMDGYETCRRVKAVAGCEDIPLLFISALSEVGDKVKAFHNGGVDYITKPFEFEEVKERIYTHLKLSRLQQEVQQLNQKLKVQVSDQLDEIERANQNLLLAQNATILALAKLSECRDTDTGTHLERVGFFCESLARRLARLPQFAKVDEDFIATIKNVAPLHDIGKVGIEDRILLKPGPLEPEEFEVMKTHTVLGAQTFLAVKKAMPDTPYAEMAYDVILHHHEKYDGSGYPEKLAGDAIPLSAQIMAVADVYDALRSARPYKKPMSREQAAQLIAEGEGRQFSPVMVTVFLQCEQELHEAFTRLQEY